MHGNQSCLTRLTICTHIVTSAVIRNTNVNGARGAVHDRAAPTSISHDRDPHPDQARPKQRRRPYPQRARQPRPEVRHDPHQRKYEPELRHHRNSRVTLGQRRDHRLQGRDRLVRRRRLRVALLARVLLARGRAAGDAEEAEEAHLLYGDERAEVDVCVPERVARGAYGHRGEGLRGRGRGLPVRAWGRGGGRRGLLLLLGVDELVADEDEGRSVG